MLPLRLNIDAFKKRQGKKRHYSYFFVVVSGSLIFSSTDILHV